MDDARLTETEMIRLLRDLADQPLPDPDLTNCELITRIRRLAAAPSGDDVQDEDAPPEPEDG